PGTLARLRNDPPEGAPAHLLAAFRLEQVIARPQLSLMKYFLQGHNLVRLHRMQARARALCATAVDRPSGEIEVVHAQVRHFGGAQPMPVSEQDSSRGCARRGAGLSWRRAEV